MKLRFPRIHMTRTKAWALLTFVIVFGLFLYLGRPPEETAETTGEDVVISPEITNIAELAAYEADKGIPLPLTDVSVPALRPAEHIRGESDAKVTIIEYNNMTNDYAKLMHPEIKGLVAARPADINWVFRHFPISGSDEDWSLAVGGECVALYLGDAGFWEYLDAVLRGEIAPTTIGDYMVGKGVESDLATSCLATDGGGDGFQVQDSVDSERIVTDDKMGAMAGVDIVNSPTFIILDNATGTMRLVEGAVTTEYLEAVIDASING